METITPDPDAKGTMIAAFEHQHMAKPMEVLEHDHFSRVDTILDYIDMLPGDDDNGLTEQQRKRMFFKTHPRSWQNAYMDTAVNFREASILQIRDYMTQKKDSAGKTRKQEKKNKQGFGQGAGRGRGFGRGRGARRGHGSGKTNVTSTQRTKHPILNTSDPMAMVTAITATWVAAGARDSVTTNLEAVVDLEAVDNSEAAVLNSFRDQKYQSYQRVDFLCT
eukprot:jgi/Psemu1/59344/gm1.59344_g